MSSYQDPMAVHNDVNLGNFDWRDVVYFRAPDRRTIHMKTCRFAKSATRWEYARSHLLNDHGRVLQAIEEFGLRACPKCMGVRDEENDEMPGVSGGAADQAVVGEDPDLPEPAHAQPCGEGR